MKRVLYPVTDEKNAIQILKAPDDPAFPDFQIVFDPASYQYTCAWAREDAQKAKELALARSKNLGIIWESQPKGPEDEKDKSDDPKDNDKISQLIQRQGTLGYNLKERKNYGKIGRAHV